MAAKTSPEAALAKLAWRFQVLESRAATARQQIYGARDRFALPHAVELSVLPDFSPAVPLASLHARLAVPFALRHNFLVQLLDYRLLPEENLFWFTAEELAARPFVETALFPFEKRLQLALDLFDILEAIHGLGLVHGTLAPASLHVLPNEELKIRGLGWRGILPEDEEGLAFLAPEIILGGEPLPASDLYSVGLLLHLLFTGKLPFASNNVRQILQQQVGGLVLSLETLRQPNGDTLPPPLAELIAHLVRKSPRERPGSAAAARERLVTLLKSGPARKRVTPLALPSEEPAEIGRAKRILSEAATLGLAITGGGERALSPVYSALRQYARAENWEWIELHENPATLDFPATKFILVLPGLAQLQGNEDRLAELLCRLKTKTPGFLQVVLWVAPGEDTLVPRDFVSLPLGASSGGTLPSPSLDTSGVAELLVAEIDRIPHGLLEVEVRRRLEKTDALSPFETLALRVLQAKILAEKPAAEGLAQAEELAEDARRALLDRAVFKDVSARLQGAVYAYLGKIYARLNLVDVAIESFAKAKEAFALEAWPKAESKGDLASAELWLALGEEERASTILETLRRRLEKEALPRETELACERLAELFWQRENLPRAGEALEKALQMEGFFPASASLFNTRRLLAEIYREEGRLAAARQVMATALENPALTSTDRATGHLVLAKIALNLFLAERAAGHLEKAREVAAVDELASMTELLQGKLEAQGWVKMVHLWEKNAALPPEAVKISQRWRKAAQEENFNLMGRIVQEALKRERKALALWFLPGTVLAFFENKKKEQSIHYARLFRECLTAILHDLAEGEQAQILGLPSLTRILAVASLALGSATKTTAADLPISMEEIWNLSHVISSKTTPQAVLEVLLDLAYQTLGAERGQVFLPEGGPFPLNLVRNFAGGDADESAATLALCRRVIAAGEPLLTLDALGTETPAAADPTVSLHLRSILCQPLSYQFKVIGCVYLDHPASQGTFTAQHQMIFSLLCDQAMVAFRNALLLEEILKNTTAIRQATERVVDLNQQLESKLAKQAEEIQQSRQVLEQTALTAFPIGVERQSMIWGISRPMAVIHELLNKIAHSEAPVLIQGESGTGKERLARIVQAESPVSSGPFVSINCAAIAPELLESELFGHVRGAFTGAENDHLGVFEQAHGGTLFLDEIGDMPLAMQGKLLRVLQEGEVRRVGDSETRPIRVRIISASHRNLKEMVQSGTFREDLLYRLNVIPISLPPLRKRKEDILPLAKEFLRQLQRPEKPALLLHPQAVLALEAYPWPGNVRELRNVMETLCAMGEGPQLMLAAMPKEIREAYQSTRAQTAAFEKSPRGENFQEAVARFEKTYLKTALLRNHENVSQASRACGMHRSTFRRLLKVHGLKAD